jgi:phosphate transport system substrate-binding protein
VDFGASDAPLKPEDEKAMSGPVVHIPTVAGAVVVAYNLPQSPQGIKLTGEAVANIYLGKITKWNDAAIAALNPGMKLPDTPVVVAHRSDGSGTTNIFTSYLKAVSPEWATKVGSGKSVKWPVGLGGKGNEGVAGIVSKTPGAVGYVELAYAIQNKFSYAALRNKAGQFVEPSVDSTTAAVQGALPALQKDLRTPIVNASGAKAYPIAGVTYILAYQKSQDTEKGKALKEFLQWAMKDGQGMAKELYYAPLPNEVVKLNEKTIASLQ